MTRSAPAQRSFASGEVSPLLWSRNDYIRNQTGLRTARGFLPLLEGGLTRAPGTWYKGRTKGDQAPRLIPFQFAIDDALILELTPFVMRVWRYGALVEKDGAPYELAIPYDAAAIERMTYVQSADVIYIADGARPIQKLKRFALDDWALEEAEFSNGPFRVQNLDEDITLQVTGGDIKGSMTITASADVFDPLHVGALFRLEAEHYTDIPLWTGGTAMPIGQHVRNDGKIYHYVRPSGSSPSSETLLIGSTLFNLNQADSSDERRTGVNPPLHETGLQKVSTDPGNWWLYASDQDGIVKITNVIDARTVEATVVKPLPKNLAEEPTYRWSEGAWSELRGYPACVEIYDQRLVAASSESEPRTLWFSAAGGYADFEPGTDADESFSYTVSGQSSMNRIIGLRSGKRALHIFAIGQELSTRSDTAGQVIGPTTTVIGLDSSYGSSGAEPIAPDGNPIIISRDGRRVVQIAYSFQDDANSATDLSRAAAHFGEEIFTQIVWQGSPQRLAWVSLASGDPVVMLFNPAEEVIGWARVPLAGGAVESLAVTPAGAGDLDTVTMAVRRTIDGESRCYIEEVADIYSASSLADFYDINHLFSGYEIPTGVPQTAFSIPHLAGETVYAWTDAGEFGPIDVAGDGTLNLPRAASRGVIGLFDATHHAETLDITAASPEGDMAGRKKRLQARVGVAIMRTAQGYMRAVERDLPHPVRERARVAIVPVQVSADLTQIYSGVVPVDIESGHANEVSLRIEPHGGAPLTITKITPTIQEAGR